MIDYAYISNNCASISIYNKENREYNHPFIGCIFLIDSQFLKLCKNFNYYLRATPRFSKPDDSTIWAIQNKCEWYKHPEIKTPYPVMYLDDLEIHWIHENNEEELLEKFKRRVGRFLKYRPTPLFIWSDADRMNDHSPEDLNNLVRDFSDIKNSIYLTMHPDLSNLDRVHLIERWIDIEGRNYSHVPTIHTVGDRIEDYIRIINTDFNNRDYENRIYKYNEITDEHLDIGIDDIIVVVTTLIHVSVNPMVGFETRSVWTPKERLDHMVKQLQTIRSKIPQAKIFLLESSFPGKLTPPEEDALASNCNYLIKYDNKDDKELMYYCHENYLNKGMGEAFVSNHFCNLIKNTKFRLLCKASGRYYLDDGFDIRNWIEDVPVFCTIKGNGRLGIITFSGFYSIPKSHLNYFLSFIELWISPNRTEPIEHILTMFAESLPNFKQVPKIYMSGYNAISPSGRNAALITI